MSRAKITRLYNEKDKPVQDFNGLVHRWLRGELRVREHQSPKTFEGMRVAFDEGIELAEKAGSSRRDAHVTALSNMTTLLFSHDLVAELQKRLALTTVNTSGFRTTLGQGFAKNIGENFVNQIVYSLADLLRQQDNILVDKGLPPALSHALELKRVVHLGNSSREIKIPIEGDLSIFERENPHNAIVVNAKTRLKEVFHIGTMWSILFDMIGDQYCMDKWNLQSNVSGPLDDVLYVFATADMVNAGGNKTANRVDYV
ncbi:MAG: hypothetical protein ABSE69_20690, partial [Roseiarcus sp.]